MLCNVNLVSLLFNKIMICGLPVTCSHIHCNICCYKFSPNFHLNRFFSYLLFVVPTYYCCHGNLKCHIKKFTSSHIWDNFVCPSSMRRRTKSTTSWLDMKFQIPSHARTINSSSAGSIISVLTSGNAVIICSCADRPSVCLYAWSPVTNNIKNYGSRGHDSL